MKKILISLLTVTALSACSWLDRITPIPPRPKVEAPMSFKVPDGFKWASPSDAELSAEWWTSYRDPILSDLEERIPKANQTLAQADAQYRQALAALDAAKASLYPTVNMTASASRAQSSVQTSSGLLAQPPASNLFQLTGVVSWVPDLWGQIHDNVAAAEASGSASQANRAAVLLSLRSQLTIDYFSLRVSDSQIALLKKTIAALEHNLDLAKDRFAAGVVAKSDVTQALSQLESARASLADARVNRSTLEHAIAVLVGETPSSFEIKEMDWPTPEWPNIPVGLPSSLLERRPDIANAERQLNAAAHVLNADQAAFFPVLTLNTQAGFESRQAPSLLSLPKSFWSIAPQLTQYIFDGGQRNAARDQQLAVVDQQTANYRQVVLTAFQQVEDSLSTLYHLKEEEQRHRASAASAQESLQLAVAQYKAGTVSYLEVITAETALYSAQSSVLADISRQATAHVQLVTALGGGWKP